MALYLIHEAEPIASDQNKLVKMARKLQDRSYRDESGMFLLEGQKLIEDAVQRGLALEVLLVSQSFLSGNALANLHSSIDEISVLENRVYKSVSTMTNPEGILAIARSPKAQMADCWHEDKTFILVVDAVQDPGNLGALIRTALAFSLTGVVLLEGTVDLYNPKVVRAAMGAILSIPVVKEAPVQETFDWLKERNAQILALDARAQTAISSVTVKGALAIIVGNEGHGLRPEVELLAKERIMIPIDSRSESLNASIAAAIAMHSLSASRIRSA